MRGVKITTDNNRRFALVTRSGSYSIIWQALPESSRVPDDSLSPRGRWHPINSAGTISSPLQPSEPAQGLCCMVRNPVERFRSACARQNVTVEQGLELVETDVHFWPLSYMGLLAEGVTYFRFPDQINDCLEWLGLSTPAQQLNEEAEEGKPTLTPEQESAIRTAYADDIVLWESLHT